eukprot:1872489-Heterocapsa_arctica.AAC.1
MPALGATPLAGSPRGGRLGVDCLRRQEPSIPAAYPRADVSQPQSAVACSVRSPHALLAPAAVLCSRLPAFRFAYRPCRPFSPCPPLPAAAGSSYHNQPAVSEPSAMQPADSH